MKSFFLKLLSGFILFSFVNFSQIKAQAEGEVGVTATVAGCGATLIIKPEKRIPDQENFQNEYLVVFYDQLYQEIYRFEHVQTDKDGNATIDLCSKGLSTTPGVYSIYVKGYSHLSKLYIDNKGFFNYTTTFDLAKTPSDYVLAGDVIDHDYVNGLDLNIVISKLYTNDLKMDLNRDGIVNSLDLSNLIYNLHVSGQLKL